MAYIFHQPVILAWNLLALELTTLDTYETMSEFATFRWDIPTALYRIIEYKPYIDKRNSIILLRCISYIVSFNMFRL